jgi:hypothetical protein
MGERKNYIVKTTWRNPLKTHIYTSVRLGVNSIGCQRRAKIEAFSIIRSIDGMDGLSYYSSTIKRQRQWIYHIKPFLKSFFTSNPVKVEGPFIIGGPWYVLGFKKEWFDLSEDQKELVGTKVEKE